ncbi:MAG: hypothetical protein CL666_14295, partial [Balneola sp.]|nr:hypothetical protein [Balneola sp.]
ENNEDNGVYAFESPSASTFLGNTIQNNGEHGLNYYSQVLDSTDVFFTGNIFKDNSLSGVVSTASIFVDNIFEGNEFGISLHGKLGHRYTDESGVDGNTFTDNTYNNVVGLEGYFLRGTLSTVFPEAITSGAYMFQRVYSNSGWSPAVSPNDTLQIQPGVLIKAWDGRYSDGAFGTIDGMIIAEGTATDPIVFTSWRDDSVGGNTNAVDDTVSARSNDWGGLYIQDRYNDNDGIAKFSRLSHVHIKYAAYGLDMEMGEQLFAEPLDNIWVSNSYNRGMVLDYGRYTVSNSIIENSQRYDGIYSYYDGDITVRNSTIRNNGAQGLYARGASGSFFREVSNSTIENNEDNGVYAFDGNNPMTFQQNKIKDNGMAGLNVTIFEAGTDTVLTISGNHISNNGEQGILSSRAIIVDDTLIGNKYPIGVTGELSKAGTVNETGNYYEGNIIENNEFNDVVTVSGDIEGVLGGAKPVSFTDNIVYGISNVEVSNTDTLIVNKGTIIKNNSSVTFDIEGHFEALGTATEKIVFTSILDDTYGGNTNGDSTNVLPEINNWSQLYLRGAATDSSEIRNVISRYANYALQLYDSDALVDSSFFSNSRYGVYVTSNATPTLRSSDFHSNYYDGVYVTSGGNPQIQLSNFYNNDRYGLYQAAGTNIIAQNNYWGDATGPFVDQGADQNLQGMGDRIYIQNGTVSYRTFLTGRNGILLGDVTENGGISPFDASKVLLHVVQTELLTGNALAAADVSGNGDVSAMDASFILQYVVGTISGFPGQGKRQSVDYREILALSYEDTEHFTDIRLDHLGGANMYSSEIEMVIPNNHIKEVEFVDSPYGDNISFLYNIEADTIRMAFASSVSLNEEGALGKIRLIYEDDAEGSNTKNLINYKHFSIDEQDITGFVNEITSDIRDDGAVIPESFNLHQNYPNPFNPTTQIAFALPQNGQVQVQVYNMLGQLVQTLVDERKTAGNYNVKWNASQFGSGTYILRIEFKGDDNQRYSQVRKMMLIK